MAYNQLFEVHDQDMWQADQGDSGTAVLEPGQQDDSMTWWSENPVCDVDDDLDDDEAYFLDDEDDDDDDFSDDYDDDDYDDDEIDDDSEEEIDDEDL
ncbi:MAG: hypothetical protein ACF8MF_13725 [Phycisphaerales bacterium JB052]